MKMCYDFDWTGPLPSEHKGDMIFYFPRILANPCESVKTSIGPTLFRSGPEVLLVVLSESVKSVSWISSVSSTVRHVNNGLE